SRYGRHSLSPAGHFYHFMKSNINANDLIIFAQVIDAGSFSLAAERIDMPKSTISRRISELETELGARLIVRSTRKLKITNFGEGVLQHARLLARQTDMAISYAKSCRSTPQGTLRVSFPPHF